MLGVYDMRALIVLLCILIFIGSAGSKAAGGAGKYDADGRHRVSIETLSVPSGNGPFATAAYIPGGRGPFPVVILSSGFLQKGAAYAPYARRLASWGIITLLRDDPTILSDLGQKADLRESRPDSIDKPTLTDQINATGMTNRIASDLLYEFDWLAGAANKDPASPLYRKVDGDHIGPARRRAAESQAPLCGLGEQAMIDCAQIALEPDDAWVHADPHQRLPRSVASSRHMTTAPVSWIRSAGYHAGAAPARAVAMS